MPDSFDSRCRQAAIAYVTAVAGASGGVITRDHLEAFVFEGQQVKLIDQSRGIRNPAQLEATISIMSSPTGPYRDHQGDDGSFRYVIRKGDWARGDNRKLHDAFERALPLIWLQKLRDAVFVPLAPVYLVGAEPDLRQYAVAVGEDLRWMAENHNPSPLERKYIEVLARQRVHQPMFRALVITAYSRSCAVCELRHVELLDAAHITPDVDDVGLPVVTNGLALCKIHHAAFDKDVLGISPDLTVHISNSVLDEVDGPMLRHGLQAFHGHTLRVIPSRRVERPDRDRLDARFTEFLKRAG